MRGSGEQTEASAEANRKRLRRGWAVFAEQPVTPPLVASGMLEPIFDVYHPDIVWDVTPMGLPDLGVMHGHDGVRGFYRSWFKEFSRVELELHGMDAAGDKVISEATQRGYGIGSGVPVEMRFWMVFTFRDGRASHMTMYPDGAPARGDYEHA